MAALSSAMLQIGIGPIIAPCAWEPEDCNFADASDVAFLAVEANCLLALAAFSDICRAACSCSGAIANEGGAIETEGAVPSIDLASGETWLAAGVG